jgi:hypothetical protein
MDRDSAFPRAVRGTEVKLILEAERLYVPFLIYRTGDGALEVKTLMERRLTVGRLESSDLTISWDDQVSRVHAELAQVAESWTVIDEGLSRNGTYLGGSRVSGRRILADKDVIRFGETHVLFRDPREASLTGDTVVAGEANAPDLTSAQKKVLAALCRPALQGGGKALTPATNQEIANELHLSIDAVKSHLRVLFGKFDVAGLAQNRKRMALVDRALECGAVDPRSLKLRN